MEGEQYHNTTKHTLYNIIYTTPISLINTKRSIKTISKTTPKNNVTIPQEKNKKKGCHIKQDKSPQQSLRETITGNTPKTRPLNKAKTHSVHLTLHFGTKCNAIRYKIPTYFVTNNFWHCNTLKTKMLQDPQKGSTKGTKERKNGECFTEESGRAREIKMHLQR